MPTGNFKHIRDARTGTTYDIYGVTNTILAVSGMAADSKVTGDAFGAISKKNDVLGIVDYGFSVNEALDEDPSSNIVKDRYGIKQSLTQITLNASAPVTSSINIRIKISKGLSRAANNAETEAWSTGLKLKSGHMYRIIMKMISGTITKDASIDPPFPVIYKCGSHNASGSRVTTGNDTVTTYTADNDDVNIAVIIRSNVTLANVVYQVVCEDMTEKTDDLLGLIQYAEGTAWT